MPQPLLDAAADVGEVRDGSEPGLVAFVDSSGAVVRLPPEQPCTGAALHRSSPAPDLAEAAALLG